MTKEDYKTEKEELLNKLFSEFNKDQELIKDNIKMFLEEIWLSAKSKNYKATIIVKLEEILDN